ncbi:unnamed protein product [Adineta ricciae]|uniref:G-protein coupled receptors family 1 profile domain-containing protein n=1 Tax=Adineta ricciae TaxID=249248 RepID=A0A814QFI1_ADIRI|nr:unnamed protein product [Adineta ricciae]CAF1126808.1 unnamed protein product [Adineta ricciae]
MSNISTTTTDSLVLNLNTARAGIQRYGQSTLFTVGMIGGILNILIFLRPSMRQNSCAIYFHASSWANIFCLCWGVLASMLAFMTNNNPASYNVFYCKFRFYMINFAQFASRAFIILACLDRFFLCSASVRHRQLCRARVAKKVVVLVTFISGCLAVYVLITYAPTKGLLPCMATTLGARIYETTSFWLFTFVIPVLSMSILSWLTIKRLKQNAKRVGREKITIAGKDMQLTGMLVAQVFLYFLTNLPYVSYVLYAALTENVPTANKSQLRISVESFLNTLLASFFYYCYNGWSFLVYTLTAPSFRRELIFVLLPRHWIRGTQQNTRHTTYHSNRIVPKNI